MMTSTPKKKSKDGPSSKHDLTPSSKRLNEPASKRMHLSSAIPGLYVLILIFFCVYMMIMV